MYKFKTTIYLTFLMFLGQLANAQKYYIPDASFRNYFITNHPSCMMSDSLITDSTTLSTITTINALNLNIQDLSGVEYFTTLDELNCSSNQLSVLPVLPTSLKTLYCFSNKLTALPPLPPKLEALACGDNLLMKISSLPASLRTIDCQYNFLDSLPPLPDSLYSLLCGNNLLPQLPPLPQKISYLSFYLNSINIIPALPASLKYLHCSFNGIYTLPVLPADLLELECNYNYISSLPLLPSSLQSLSFTSNKVSAFPNLPASLMILNCEDNKLDFADIVPAMFVNSIVYAPQDSIGISYRDTISSGSDFFLDATAGYNAFNSYQWYKNNLLISSTTRIHASSDLFLISPVILADSAIYFCQVTNSKAPDLTLNMRKSYLSVTGNDVTGLPAALIFDVFVFPNPASELIRIDNKSSVSMNARLVNIQGNLIWEGEINSATEKNLDISKFEKGLYLLSLNNEKGRVSKKIIFQ